MGRERKKAGERGSWPLIVEQIALPVHMLSKPQMDELGETGQLDGRRVPGGIVMLTFARRLDPREHPLLETFLSHVAASRWAKSQWSGAAAGSSARLEPLARDILDRLSEIGVWTEMAERLLKQGPSDVLLMDIGTASSAAGFYIGLDVGVRAGEYGALSEPEAREFVATLRRIAAEAEAFGKERELEGAHVEIASYLGGMEPGFIVTPDDELSARLAIEGKLRCEERAALEKTPVDGTVAIRPRRGV